jgi:hypothetical protein
MRTTFVMALAAGLFLLGSTQAPADWVRHGTAVTPRGVYSGTSYGACGGGSCYRAGRISGPSGRSVSGSSSVTRTAPGQVIPSGSVTGPGGATVSRGGVTTCVGTTCTHSGTVTAPNGGTVTTVGESVRP